MDVMLPARFRGASLSDFERDAIAEVFELIDAVDDLPEVPERHFISGQGWSETGETIGDFRGMDGLVIVGPTGVGKTHLLAAIANALHARERLFRSALTLVDEAKARVSSGAPGGDEHRFEAILMLDDISGIRPTDFAIDTISRIIRHRYDEHLPTIVTMHSSKSAISDIYGGAIASRISQLGPILELDGPDRRAPRPRAR